MAAAPYGTAEPRPRRLRYSSYEASECESSEATASSESESPGKRAIKSGCAASLAGMQCRRCTHVHHHTRRPRLAARTAVFAAALARVPIM